MERERDTTHDGPSRDQIGEEMRERYPEDVRDPVPDERGGAAREGERDVERVRRDEDVN